MTESKVRLAIADEEIFYYPDVMVYCEARDTDPYFKRFPRVLVEILSASTEAIDRREKFVNYRQIETLAEYVLVAQDRRDVTVFRRSTLWQPACSSRPEQTISLPSLEFQMTLADVYEGVAV